VIESSSKRGLGVILGDCVARPGEEISPQRDDVRWLLF